MNYCLIDGDGLYQTSVHRHSNTTLPILNSTVYRKVLGASEAEFSSFLTNFSELIIDKTDGVSALMDVDFAAYLLNRVRVLSSMYGKPSPVALVWDGAFSHGVQNAPAIHRVKECQNLFSLKYSRSWKTSKERADIAFACMLADSCNINSYCFEGYETYDTMFTLVEHILSLDANNTVDIITSNRDMLPLMRQDILADGTVVDRVTVYLRTTNVAQGAPGKPTIDKYFALNGSTFEKYSRSISAFKKYDVPFNAVLLHSCMCGETRYKIPALYSLPFFDGVTPKRSFGNAKFQELLNGLQERGYDIGKLFSYYTPVDDMMTALNVCGLTKSETVVELTPSVSSKTGLPIIDKKTGLPKMKQVKVKKEVPDIEGSQMLEKMLRFRTARRIPYDNNGSFVLKSLTPFSSDMMRNVSGRFGLGLKV